MLTGPIVNAVNGEILGVLQLINTREGDHFSAIMEDGMRLMCGNFGGSFRKTFKTTTNCA